MFIIISSEGDDFQSQPNPRFGRTTWFIKYDLENENWSALKNPAITETGGAGVVASQFVIDQEASVAISGSFGPNAHKVLSAASIKMLTFDNNYRTIEDVVKGYITNSLTTIKKPD